ncbi:MAG: hypothetical protein CM1200mP10_20410 [Candidatus Neomarinimicrobiota bacterium]|nr:MAG: hypothetical protein CM1200mP10_20410 [Candidatus Neomarinimicrobiota bacterium]
MNWSHDGRKLVYAKYHFGKHQSMVYDIKVYDLDKKSAEWLTQSERATYPDWSPDGQQMFMSLMKIVYQIFTQWEAMDLIKNKSRTTYMIPKF